MSLAAKSAILLSVAGLVLIVAGAAFLFTGDRDPGVGGLAVGLVLIVVSAVLRNTVTVNPETLPDAHPPGTDDGR